MKKWIALLLALTMMAAVFAGCGKSGGNTGNITSGQGSAAATSADNINDQQVVKLLYHDEISDWNPLHPSSANTWCNWIDSLVEYDNFGMCQPCLAESWTKESFTYTDEEGNEQEGQRWVFKIREGVRWQNYDGSFYGEEEVVAEDWVTTAKWILNPANGARTADLLFDFVGAEKYFDDMQKFEDGVATTEPDFETVGMKAISKYELAMDLTKACPYFLSRLTYNWGYPTCAKFMEEQGDRFGTNNKTILYCGAFLCKEWEQNSYYIEERNPEYWDIEDIHVERIENRYNAESNTLAPEALLRGEVTYADIPTSQIDEWLRDPEKAKLIRPNRPGSYSYFYLINCMPTYEEKVMEGYQLSHDQWTAAANNLNFRKSLFWGLDRVRAISCYDPYTPETYELRTITPKNFCAADGKDFTDFDELKEYTEKSQYQPDLAREYRDKAIEELKAQGVTFPIVAYMPYMTDSTQVELAQVVSQQIENDLGSDYIKFVLEGYPSTDYLSTTRRAGNYSFMMSYWGPDYADPETWTDPFNLGQAYNYWWHLDGMATQTSESDPEGRKGRREFDETYWKNFPYSEMVKAASAEVVDLSKRYHAFAEVEAYLLDNAVVMPLGTLGGCGYLSSYMNPFESQFAAFGMSDGRYKYQVVMKAPMDTETYLEKLPIWEAERAERIAKAQAEGRDY